MYQPGRRVLGQQVDEMFAFRLPTHASQCFQHRQVGFPLPIMIDALPAANPELVVVLVFVFRGKTSQKCFDHTGLANPHLAGNEDKLACTIQRPLQPFLQLGELGFSSH